MWVEGYEPILGTVDVVEKLSQLGHELIFLSDNVKERVEYLDKKYSFLRKFKK